jgi:hypothetical protein
MENSKNLPNQQRLSIDLLKSVDMSEYPEFLYLLNQLEQFYNSQVSLISDLHHYKYKQNLFKSLHILLAEIILTDEKSNRKVLTEKTYKWFAEICGVKSRETKSCTPKFSTSKHCLNDSIDRRSLSTSKFAGFYLPKIKSPIERKEVLRNSYEKYRRQKSEESIYLQNRLITPIAVYEEKGMNGHQIEINRQDTPKEKTEKNKEEEEKTIPSVYNFRYFSQKSRITSLKLRKMPYRTNDVSEIADIKKKLAFRKQIVSAKALENALAFPEHVPLVSAKKQSYPKGGEFLLKNRCSSIIHCTKPTKKS